MEIQTGKVYCREPTSYRVCLFVVADGWVRVYVGGCVAICRSGHQSDGLALRRLADIFASTGYGRWTKRVDFRAIYTREIFQHFLRFLSTLKSPQIIHFNPKDFNANESDITTIYSTLSQRFGHSQVPGVCRGYPGFISHCTEPKSNHPLLRIPFYTIP